MTARAEWEAWCETLEEEPRVSECFYAGYRAALEDAARIVGPGLPGKQREIRALAEKEESGGE